MSGGGRPAFFLDRDGTLIRDVGYLARVEQVDVLDGAAEAVRLVNRAGARAVVATNQSGVARGMFGESDVRAVHEFLRGEFARRGAVLDAFYYCPHHPEAEIERYRRRCRCRKPAPGLLRRAARELGLDLTRSVMLGDTLRDVEAGRRAGCASVLVLTGKGEKQHGLLHAGETGPDRVAADVLAGVQWALEKLGVQDGD